MKILFALFSVLIIMSGKVFAQTENPDSVIVREMSERRIPGLQVAVVKDGKIVFSKSYGTANLEYKVPVTAQTLFDINSCTKAFTGVAIMQLAAAEKIDLSSPVSRYLDSLPAAWQKVTIRQLLTHVSGIPDIAHVLDAAPGGLEGLGGEQVAWKKTMALPMDFPTGERYRYNQTNYALLGKIIDKVSGEPFVSYFEHGQFRPAGMTSTGFGGSRDVIPGMAQTYTYVWSLDGEQLPQQTLINSYADFPLFRRTASGMISTATDVANWLISLQNGKLLHQRSLDTLWTPGRFNNGSPTLWALGWVTRARDAHPAILASGGGRSAFIVYPHDGLSIVILTNLAGAFPERFFDEVAECYLPDVLSADPFSALHVKTWQMGFSQAEKAWADLKMRYPNFDVPAADLNDWGYRLASAGRSEDALQIFKLNVKAHPDDWNAYDSYGEVLLKNGHKAEAIKMYQRSVQLNPANENGKKVLQQITQ